jgi:hypothetical protein
LKYGFIFTPTSALDCDGDTTANGTDETPSGAVSSDEEEPGAGVDTAQEMGRWGSVAPSNLPTLKKGGRDGRLNNICRSGSPIGFSSQPPVSDSPSSDSPEKIGSSSSGSSSSVRFDSNPLVDPSRDEEKSTATATTTQKKPKVEPVDPSCVSFDDLKSVWTKEQETALNHHGWKPTRENIGLRERLQEAGLLHRKDLVLFAFWRFIKERCCEEEAPIYAPLAIFRDEFEFWVDLEAKDHQAEHDLKHLEALRIAAKVKQIRAEDLEYEEEEKRRHLEHAVQKKDAEAKVAMDRFIAVNGAFPSSINISNEQVEVSPWGDFTHPQRGPCVIGLDAAGKQLGHKISQACADELREEYFKMHPPAGSSAESICASADVEITVAD